MNKKNKLSQAEECLVAAMEAEAMAECLSEYDPAYRRFKADVEYFLNLAAMYEKENV